MKGKRRITTISITLAVLFIWGLIAPNLGLEFDFGDNAITLIGITILTAIISDMVFKKIK